MEVITATGPAITSAALIMVVVFLSFALGADHETTSIAGRDG